MIVGHMVGHVAEIFTTAACIYLGGASSICAVAGKVVHEFIIEPLVDTFFYNKTFNYNYLFTNEKYFYYAFLNFIILKRYFIGYFIFCLGFIFDLE